MHDPDVDVALLPVACPQVVARLVDDRAVAAPVRLDQESRWLVDRETVVVLVENVERQLVPPRRWRPSQRSRRGPGGAGGETGRCATPPGGASA
jgi:hypothetical protein